MNKVILVGRLAREVDVRYTGTGKAVASFSLAVNKYGKKDEADFIPVVLWEKLAELAGNSLRKGNKILIEGHLSIRSYETNDGQKRRVAEVIAQNMEFLESKKQQSGDESHHSSLDGIPDEQIPF